MHEVSEVYQQHNRGRNACQHRKLEWGRNFYQKWKDIHVASVNLAVFEDICNTGTVTDVAYRGKKNRNSF